jgi:hypothetical protein
MAPPQARPTPPQREPLTYFGEWCGQGWSAGREGQSALSPADLRKPAIVILNRNGARRASPVDEACKLHDIAYDAIARQTDSYKAAQMKLAADRALLTRVGGLLAADQRGQGDLNMGEVLYARNVQMAFRTMLFFDGVAVARNLQIPAGRAARGAARKGGAAAMHVANAGVPYVLVLIAGPQTIVPMVLRLRLAGGK